VKDKEIICKHCGIIIPPEQYRSRQGKICRVCGNAHRQQWRLSKKSASEERIQQAALLEGFKYKNRTYQDGDVISLFIADAEENAVRMKIYSTQQKIAEYQARQQPSLIQQGDYWTWS